MCPKQSSSAAVGSWLQMLEEVLVRVSGPLMDATGFIKACAAVPVISVAARPAPICGGASFILRTVCRYSEVGVRGRRRTPWINLPVWSHRETNAPSFLLKVRFFTWIIQTCTFPTLFHWKTAYLTSLLLQFEAHLFFSDSHLCCYLSWILFTWLLLYRHAGHLPKQQRHQLSAAGTHTHRWRLVCRFRLLLDPSESCCNITERLQI